MEVEIISVGSELVLGQIVNTNVAYLADQLRQLNLVAHYQTTVDDEPARIEAALKTARTRAQLVFVCGGLGPTADDQTMPSVARGLGRKLVLDEDHWQAIQRLLKQRAAGMPAENIRQAYYIEGGQPLANPAGLALGALVTVGETTVGVFPGPPREFKAMVDQSLVPELKRRFPAAKQVTSRLLHFAGRPESLLMDEITAVLGDLPVVATSYVQPDEIQVRLRVDDRPAAAAAPLLDQATRRIVAKEGAYYFGSGEGVTLAGQVVKLLAAAKLTITAAESLTGGLFQSTLCGVSGASKVFAGGFVTYAARAKTKLVGVPAELIAEHGVVSAETAAAMATGARETIGADLGVAFTGVAGPDPLEGQPAGTVYVAIAQAGQPAAAWRLDLAGYRGRQVIRQQSVTRVLLALYRRLREKTGNADS